MGLLRRRIGWAAAACLAAAALVVVGALGAAACSADRDMPGRSFAGPRPPPTPAETESRERLEADVRRLAGAIGERNTSRPEALALAAEHVRASLAATGKAPRAQTYRAGGVDVSNWEIELPGAQNGGEIVIVGAHYDSARGTPGADDNASGTAALLELARLLAPRAFARTLRLVAFVNEEPPWFDAEGMGSRRYAAAARARGDRVVAMLSLEMLGFYSDEPGLQRYPPFLGGKFPDRADYVAFVANRASAPLLRRAIGAFRRTPFPSEGIAASDRVPGLGWSDHAPFWEQGWPALMVTDTALFRNRRYHKATDTPDTLDYDGLARVVRGLAHVVADLADAPPAPR